MWKIIYSCWLYEKTHQTVHEGCKNFKCESCGKLFTQVGHLITHIKTIHEGKKDYKCDNCGKLFAEARDLRRHITTAHCQN